MPGQQINSNNDSTSSFSNSNSRRSSHQQASAAAALAMSDKRRAGSLQFSALGPTEISPPPAAANPKGRRRTSSAVSPLEKRRTNSLQATLVSPAADEEGGRGQQDDTDGGPAVAADRQQPRPPPTATRSEYLTWSNFRSASAGAVTAATTTTRHESRDEEGLMMEDDDDSEAPRVVGGDRDIWHGRFKESIDYSAYPWSGACKEALPVDEHDPPEPVVKPVVEIPQYTPSAKGGGDGEEAEQDEKKKAAAVAPSEGEGSVERRHGKRIWGLLPAPWLWIAVAGIVLVVCGLVAGLVGGLLARRGGAGGPAMPNQNLAAVNWTTAGNVSNHIVFTQASDSSLVAYRESGADGYKEINITDRLARGSLPVKVGSPLAAVARFDPGDYSDEFANQLRVYYTTPGNSVVELATYDESLTDWHQGLVGPYMNHSLEAGANSQLAATWRRCRNETECGQGELFVTYETSQVDGYNVNVMIANMTNNWDPSLAVERIDPDFGLAIISVQAIPPEETNASDYAWAFYKDGGVIAGAWEDYAHNWEWTDASQSMSMPEDSVSNYQSIAAVSYRDRTHVMVVVLNSDQSVKGNHWDPEYHAQKEGWRGVKPLDLLGSPTESFSTIAMTADARLYGLGSDGRLLAYEMNTDDPYQFTFRGEVAQVMPQQL